jgi:hypothetical protein
MKPILLTSLFLFLAFSAKSQIEKGAFMAEGGVSLVNKWDFNDASFTEGFGYWHFNRDGFSETYIGSGESFIYNYRSTGYALGPKLGYVLWNNFVVGLDYKYRWNSVSYTYSKPKERFNTSQTGVFARKYFRDGVWLPFIEGGLGFGNSKSVINGSSPGGAQYQRTNRRDLIYYYGAGGISYSINQRFLINLFAKVQHTKDTPVETASQSTSETRSLDSNVALVLSVSYFLKPKSKQ